MGGPPAEREVSGEEDREEPVDKEARENWGQGGLGTGMQVDPWALSRGGSPRLEQAPEDSGAEPPGDCAQCVWWRGLLSVVALLGGGSLSRATGKGHDVSVHL